jgi:hypothetical protein
LRDTLKLPAASRCTLIVLSWFNPHSWGKSKAIEDTLRLLAASRCTVIVLSWFIPTLWPPILGMIRIMGDTPRLPAGSVLHRIFALRE